MNKKDVENIRVKQYTESEITKCYGIYNTLIKREIDFLLALVFTVILLPVYLVISVLILLDDGGPVFYKPLRGGYRGKDFHIIKFRTMVKNADKIGGGTTAYKDPRVTKIGRILRRTKMDETPQLINIIKGEMAFVGPRPELLKYTEKYEGAEKKIFDVRPGITDFGCIYITNLDEICGNESADDIYEKYVLKKKNELRVKYAAEVSLKTDLYIFFYTLYTVLRKYVLKNQEK